MADVNAILLTIALNINGSNQKAEIFWQDTKNKLQLYTADRRHTLDSKIQILWEFKDGKDILGK